MKVAKRLFRRLLKSQVGITLIETASVIAITATIAAVVTPIAVDKINDAKKAAAKEDCTQMKNAVTAFFSGTGNYPSLQDSTHLDFYTVLRSGNIDQINATLGAALNDPLPYSGSQADTDGWQGTNFVDLMRNHLVYDNPNGTTDPSIPGNTATGGYATAKIPWKGPYIATADKQDPWGHNYLAFIKGASTAATPKIFGWIISAGPNGKIETPTTSGTVQGDDVGIVIGSKEAGTFAAASKQ